MLIVKCISKKRGTDKLSCLSSTHSFAFLQLTTRHSNWNLVCGGFRCHCVRFSLCCFLSWAYQTYLPYHSLHGADTHPRWTSGFHVTCWQYSSFFFFFFPFCSVRFSLHPVKSFFLSWNDFLFVAKTHTDICGSDCFVMILFLFDIRN